MIKIILYVISLALLVNIAVWFAETPGSVAVEWHNWRLDTSVAILFVFFALTLAFGTILLRAWSALIGGGRAIRDSRKDRRVNVGLNALAQGFAAVRSGDVGATSKAIREARAVFGDNEAVRFLEQQASRLNGDAVAANDQAQTLLSDTGMELAALRDLATLAADAGDREKALGYALQAMDRKPLSEWSCAMALDLHIALGRWEDAAALAERKDVHAALNRAEMPKLRAILCSRAAEAALSTQTPANAIKWARKGLASDRTNAQANAILGTALIADGKSKKAASELVQAWSVNPDARLLSAYFQIAPAEAPLARASRVEKLVAGNLEHPESRLARADAALAAKLWGQARSSLEPLLDKDISPSVLSRAATLMGRVELGDNGNAKNATQSLITALEALTKTEDTTPPQSADDLLG